MHCAQSTETHHIHREVIAESILSPSAERESPKVNNFCIDRAMIDIFD